MEAKGLAIEQRLGSTAQPVDGADSITTTVVMASDAEQCLIAALRQGDETTCMMLVERYQPTLRLVRMYVTDVAVAEEPASGTQTPVTLRLA